MAAHWTNYSFRRTRVEGSLSDEKITAQFAQVDTNGSGFIEPEELEVAAKTWAEETRQPAPSHQEMLAFADTDRDGRISLSEFIKVMRFVPPKPGTSPAALEVAPALSPQLQAEKEAFIKSKYGDIQTASVELRDDKEVMLVAMQSFAMAFQYSSERLRADKAFVLNAFGDTGSADNLKYAAKSLRGDAEVVRAAVEQFGAALEHASADLQADPDLVLLAVLRTHTGSTLGHASAQLRADRQIVRTAIGQHAGALEYAAPELRADPLLVRVAVSKKGTTLAHASAELRADKQLVITAVKQDANALQYASAELRADKQLVITAVKQDANALQYASAELQQDREVLDSCVD